MYGHPLIQRHEKLPPGLVVEHRKLPGVALVVVSGPYESISGSDKYIVKMPDGKTVPVLEENLIMEVHYERSSQTA